MGPFTGPEQHKNMVAKKFVLEKVRCETTGRMTTETSERMTTTLEITILLTSIIEQIFEKLAL